MEWSHFDAEYMTVAQEKTDARLTIYCQKMLREFLETWPRAGRFIIPKNLTQRISYDGIEKAFRTVRNEIAEERPEAAQFTLHGLRYLAALELAEAGCSDAEIKAETPYLLGTGGRTRTGKILQSGDFESPASTIPPHRPVLLT